MLEEILALPHAQQMVMNNIYNNKTIVIIIIYYQDKVMPLRSFQPPWVRQTFKIIGAARL